MKAAYLIEKGPPEVIRYGELPNPKPGKGQALVKILAASVNPIDTYIRSGRISMDLPNPYIPGCDLAGIVEEVGTGVQNVRIGDRVWASNQGVYGRQGTFAEYASVDEHWLYPIPEGLSETGAAAGALTGITAHLGLFSAGALQPGETVFVNGGTGGVGSAAVQLAKWAGAKVITTAGNKAKRDLCAQWGADLVVDYRSKDLNEEIKSFCQSHGEINLWIETQREPGFDCIIPLMAHRGRIILMAGEEARPPLPIGPFYFKELRLQGLLMMMTSPAEQRKSAGEINSCFQNGKWHPLIGRVFPLADAAAAHVFQEENTLGKQGTLTGKIIIDPAIQG